MTILAACAPSHLGTIIQDVQRSVTMQWFKFKLSAPIHFGRNDRNVVGRFEEWLAIAPVDGKRLESWKAWCKRNRIGHASAWVRRRIGLSQVRVILTYPTYPYLSLIILSYPCYVSSTHFGRHDRNSHGWGQIWREACHRSSRRRATWNAQSNLRHLSKWNRIGHASAWVAGASVWAR